MTFLQSITRCPWPTPRHVQRLRYRYWYSKHQETFLIFPWSLFDLDDPAKSSYFNILSLFVVRRHLSEAVFHLGCSERQ